jgi:xanthine dehydrogenase small subunit
MAETIRFLHRGQVRQLEDFPPTRTVLDFLREDERRCGTKEGCNEGDCGACTVVLGAEEDGKLVYRAVNACILFLGALDGKELLTVEDLAGADGALHKVQHSMVDCHGSQCGFCTPGIVMSLYALHVGGEVPDRQRIDTALAGNLCRCTGYRPIIQAAQAMGVVVPDTAKMGEKLELLRSIRGDASALLPRSADALADLLLHYPDATLVAGGTDVGLWVTKQFRDLGRIIHLGQVADLQQMERADGWLRIGAGVTVARAADALGGLYPDLAVLFRRYGSQQVRNSATLGGNIANGSPIGDSMPALIALGARLVLRRGTVRRELALEDFFLAYRQTALQPGEFLESILVPEPPPDLAFACYKISKRFDQDISAVMAGFGLLLDGGIVRAARLAYGGMAGTPKRAAAAEAALIGRPFDAAAARDAATALAQDFQPVSDMRASADYRLLVAGNLILKFQAEWVGAAPATTRVPAFQVGGVA